MKKTLLVICIIGIILGVGYFLYSEIRDKALAGVILPRTFTDLIGTRIASTTTYVDYYNFASASTTYPFALFGASQANVVFTINKASSSGAVMNFNILGSNDPNCSTATTTTIYNLMTKNEIRWFDALNYLNGSSVITAIGNATSSISWTGITPGMVRQIHLVDLDIECLAIEINASSTQVNAHYKLKAN